MQRIDLTNVITGVFAWKYAHMGDLLLTQVLDKKLSF